MIIRNLPYVLGSLPSGKKRGGEGFTRIGGAEAGIMLQFRDSRAHLQDMNHRAKRVGWQGVPSVLSIYLPRIESSAL